MASQLKAGAMAGLLAGVAFGLMMQFMPVSTPDGGQMPMMGMVAQVVRSNSLAVGWIYHLFNSLLIGGIFGWLLGAFSGGYGPGITRGVAYGALWWILGGLILMPVLLGMPAFAPLLMPPMRMIALGSLIGHVVYGLILGATYVALTGRAGASIPAEGQRLST